MAGESLLNFLDPEPDRIPMLTQFAGYPKLIAVFTQQQLPKFPEFGIEFFPEFSETKPDIMAEL